MKRMITTLLLCLCITSCAHMNITPVSGSSEKLDKSGKVLVVAADDGRYGATIYTGTGNELASLLIIEFAKYASGQENLPHMALDKAISAAKLKNAKYVVIPEVLHYEDRNTVWSGRRDHITVKVTVYLAEDGSVAQSSMITANNQWATLVNNRPMVLLNKPLAEMVKNFY